MGLKRIYNLQNQNSLINIDKNRRHFIRDNAIRSKIYMWVFQYLKKACALVMYTVTVKSLNIFGDE